MISTSSFFVNHGFIFCHCEGFSLTCRDEDTLSPFVVPKDYECLCESRPVEPISCSLEYLPWFVARVIVQRVLAVLLWKWYAVANRQFYYIQLGD